MAGTKNTLNSGREALPPERATISQLDTIRVAAMLGVFFHHLWKTVIPAPQTPLQDFLNPGFEGMAGSVILFNIISGFLLSLPHLGPDRRPPMSYGTFLKKRFLRIVPPYYIALIIFTIVNILHFGFPLLPASIMLIEHLTFVNSLDYSNMLSNFSHFWYLGLLAQFYLLFPLILRFFIWLGPRPAAISIMVVCWGSWQVLAWFIPENQQFPGFAENLMHFNLPGRLPEFAVGMWLASLWRTSAQSDGWKILDRPFLIFAGASALFFAAATPFHSVLELPLLHIYYVAPSVVFFLILFFWSASARTGELRAVKAFATQTYAVYIVHHPLFSFVGVMPSTVAHTVPNFLLLSALLLPLCYVGAVVLGKISDFAAEKIF